MKGELSDLPAVPGVHRQARSRSWSPIRWLGLFVGLFLLGATVLVVGPVVGPRPTSAAAASDPVLVVAGDISCGNTDPNFNGGNSNDCQQQATANLIHNIAPNYLLPGGDTQYDAHPVEGGQPTTTDYTDGYDGSWGQLQNPGSSDYVAGLVVRPTPGDNEYGDANENDRGSVSTASNYYANFGSSGLNDLPAGVTNPSSDFYSFDIPVNGGTWHIISLDSECAALPATQGGAPSQSAAGCATGSPEETFLRNDLSTHQGDCTLIHWHEPAQSEVFGTNSDYQAFWNDATEFHATAIVNGHAHDYERWMPLDASGNPDPNGVVQIIAGTGGNSHSSDTNPSSDVVHDDFNHFGVLQLTLQAGSVNFCVRNRERHLPRQRHDQLFSSGLGCELERGPAVGRQHGHHHGYQLHRDFQGSLRIDIGHRCHSDLADDAEHQGARRLRDRRRDGDQRTPDGGIGIRPHERRLRR